MSETETWLDYLHLCIKRYIHRFGYRMVQTTGTLSALFISVDEARRLLGTQTEAELPPPPPALRLPPPEETDAQLTEAEKGLVTLAGQDGALGMLRRCFGLDDRQLRLLLAAAGPLISVDLARLYSFAWADFSVKLPTVGFLAELLASPSESAQAWQEEFASDAPLVRYRLVELRDGSAWGAPSPLLHRGVVVPDGVLAFLRGDQRWRDSSLPSALQSAVAIDRPEAAASIDRLFLPARSRRDLEASLGRALVTGRPRLLLVGPDGVGRRTALAAYAARRGFGLLTVDLHRLSRAPDQFVSVLSEAGREALMRRCVLVLEGDELFEMRELWERLLPGAAQLVNRHAGPVAITARTSLAALHRQIADLFDVIIPLPEPVDQREVWRRALGERDPVDEALASPLGNRFNVSPGTIYASVEEARARRVLTGAQGPLSVDEVSRAVRHRLDHMLSQVAEPFTTSLGWEDVILPEDVRLVLDEIIAQARHREIVYDAWGFRRKMSYGRGLSCLFIGPPGTGKTMVTALIAQTLGRELYRVDLSRVISKWVGETEKNLARVFDEAEKAQVILLFDEADALFGSRTEVKGSNDRFANMEINYLLQRMESFDGMSLLTTNFAKSIDEAFKRRLKFRVDFPMPDAEQRAQLWSSMLPSTCATEGDLKFEYLGKRFKMAGGNIKNAVLRAAFFAADEKRPIDAGLLERAAIAEAREMGRLI
ncbi:MAG: AAA family ATPase [Myxococcales bacterium]|nr:AAA family ATPase [Myxococcales bacterium]